MHAHAKTGRKADLVAAADRLLHQELAGVAAGLVIEFDDAVGRPVAIEPSGLATDVSEENNSSPGLPSVALVSSVEVIEHFEAVSRRDPALEIGVVGVHAQDHLDHARPAGPRAMALA